MRNTYNLLAALLLTMASFRGLAQTGSAETAATSRVAASGGSSAVANNETSATTRVGAPAPEEPGKIQGKVGSSTGQPIEAATIALLNARDSSVVKVTSTNKAGQFHFNNLPVGKYIISATSVGYGAVLSQSFEVTDARTSQTLPAMTLTATSTSLAAISVVGKRPLIEQKADRMVVNVDASPSNSGSTVMDVLEKSPGISLDKDDNISLKGKQGVTIMIDNKPTYLSASQLASYLRSRPDRDHDQPIRQVRRLGQLRHHQYQNEEEQAEGLQRQREPHAYPGRLSQTQRKL
jgi:hypothetical protein